MSTTSPERRRGPIGNALSAEVPEFISRQVTSACRFYCNLKPRASRAFTVVCGGVEECATDFVINRNTFPYWAIEFVAEGTGDLRLGGKNHVLSAGTVFAYGPHVPHTIRSAADPHLVKYFVDFLGAPSLPLLRASGIKPGSVLQVSAIGDVRSAFDALIRLGLQHDSRTDRTCALQLELLLHTIARSNHPANPFDRRARETFERVRHYMDTHFLEVASIGQVTTTCHVDTSHLSRLFRRFLNESPLRYLLRRRMQWAADRLQGSSKFVREVADELGIDPFQFSRTFKRVHGVSPMEFLRTHGQITPEIGMRRP